MADNSLGPVPKTITGGCLCGSVRYRVNFPKDHDFIENSAICQCTQCRKQTGSLFMAAFRVPLTSVTWLPATSTTTEKDTERTGSDVPPGIKTFAASLSARRAFCGNCGSFLFWRSLAGDGVSFTVGSVDALYLFGEGADGTEVPREGFGRALCSGGGVAEWCRNEIKGVTDDLPLLFRGQRHDGDSWE